MAVNKSKVRTNVRGKKTSTQKKSKRGKRRNKGGKWLGRTILGALLLVLLGLFFYLMGGQKGHKGIDVSHHQGNIDWETVGKAGDLEFVFLKATEGLQTRDDTFERNLHGARNARLKVGAYHFFVPQASGKDQFSNFVRVVGKDIDLKPVLDLELSKIKITDASAYRTEVKAFIDACRAYYGIRPIVYASPSFIKDFQLEEVIANCPYWIAWYAPGSKLLRSRRRYLMMAYPGTQAVVWQYTEKGRHAGIAGYVDLDECWEMPSIEM